MPKKKATSKTAAAMARVGTIISVPEVLRSLGCNPYEVLAEVGVDLDLFDDPDNLMTYAARGRLIAHCATQAGCSHFGLLLGKQVQLSSVGLIGLLVKLSKDVGTALQSLEKFFFLHVRGAIVKLDIEGRTAILSYQAYQPGVQGGEQVGDGAVAALFNVMRELNGRDWKPAEAWFVHARPDDVEPFRNFFRVRLRFNAERYALVFPSRWLSRPLPEGNPEMRRLLGKQIDALVARSGDDFLEQVRSVLRTLLLTGDVQAEQLAAHFSMHPRTFSRRLNAYDVGFQALADETRFEMAQQLLSSSELQVNEVALLLQYADARSFIRAFRRWSGTTPARWRIRKR